MSEHVLTDKPDSSTSLFVKDPERYQPMLALWGGAFLLSAFLLFQVQPILTKLILPWFGGSAAVWTTSLMFFQVAYLLGNLYAYWLVQRTSPRVQSRVHVALLAMSFLLLPILPSASWKPAAGEHPTLYILGVLATTVGLPFVFLSATSPLLQAWYVRRREGGRPYRFYALSNAGSLFALLSYPVLVEPYFTTRHGALGWSLAYVVFGLCCAAIAFHSSRVAPSFREEPRAGARPDWKLRLLWMALAADAAALLLSITNHISQNVAAVPMLWIVPLSLYLLSLILCFEGHRWYRRFFFLRLLAVALGGMTYALSADFANAGPALQVPLFCAGLFVCCMVCHGELEKLKPSPEHLTLFYLMVAAGGALGGIFVSIVAPLVFRGFYELPVAIAGCAILIWVALYRDPSTILHRRWWRPASLLAIGSVAILSFSLYRVTIRQGEQARVTVRNFYGVLRVRDVLGTGFKPPYRELINGTIVHGVGLREAGRLTQPTTYYGPESGAALALLSARKQGSLDVGIVGLGAGTLASYGQDGDGYTFYEIDPLVTRMAQAQFAFLRESKANVEIIPGDARLSLEREPERQFDVLLIDAFSGDSIPIHLLTRQAFELYLNRLRPHGLLAVHISNRFLDLEPVIQAAARSLQMSTATVVNSADEANLVYTATWVLLAREPQSLPVRSPRSARTAVPAKNSLLWTDDYSNLLRILK